MVTARVDRAVSARSARGRHASNLTQAGQVLAAALGVERLRTQIDALEQTVRRQNEVIDALPTPRFAIEAGEVYEEGVQADATGTLTRTDRPAAIFLPAGADA